MHVLNHLGSLTLQVNDENGEVQPVFRVLPYLRAIGIDLSTVRQVCGIFAGKKAYSYVLEQQDEEPTHMIIFACNRYLYATGY